MTNYADWEDLHFDAAPVEADWAEDIEDWGGFEDESDWEYEMQFGGGEDSYLDTHWEDMVEMQAGFWGGE